MNTNNFKREMKKFHVGHLAILCAGVFLAFAIIGSVLLAAGGFGKQAWDWNLLNIGPGQTYEINDRDEQDLNGIASIRLTAVQGVTVLHGGDKVFSELKGSSRSTTGPVKLAVTRSGSTLYIEAKYPQASVGINSSDVELTVTIPDGYQGNLEVYTVSGNVAATGLPQTLGDVSVNVVSGDVEFDAAAYQSLDAKSVSGHVTVGSAAARTTVNTVSGDVRIGFARFAETSVRTISGNVMATLPADAAFQVDFSSISGSFSSDHPAMAGYSAKREFQGAAGNGGEIFRVETTSGNFRVTEQ